jgi:hypothetical protein
LRGGTEREIMSGIPPGAENEPEPDPEDAELIRQAKEIFKEVEGKPFVSDSLQQRNEWRTESPPQDSDEPKDDDDDPIL